MKQSWNRWLALTLTAALLLSGCSGAQEAPKEEDTSAKQEESKQESTSEKKEESKQESSEQNNENAIKDLVYPRLATREMETFNILYSQRLEDHENLCNLTDGLLEVDTYGRLVPCLAEEWGTEDGGKTWTFHLRDGVKWVDMNAAEKGVCTSRDFATGLEWVLNYHKNDSSNTSMPVEMLKGASEYYEYTKGLSKEEAYALDASDGSKFLEMVGIEVPDDKTVIYHCLTEKPYFDSVAAYACLYPMAQGMIDELGGPDGVKSMSNENMWYNGCYTMTSYIQGNEKVYTKNPTYWDQDCELFDTVTVKMIESNDVAFQLYQSGEVDYVDLTESNVQIISGSESNEYHDYLVPAIPMKYSFQFHFNYNKLFADGTPDENWNKAVANEAFRKAWYYGLDFKEYYKRYNALVPMSCENNFYTMKGLCYTSDGTEYTELVRQELGLPELNGETMVRLDADKAAQYKKQAMEELTALGVTFPVQVDYFISASNQTDLDSANVLKQLFEDGLGTDFIQFNINTFVSKINNEVVKPHLHSFVTNGWGADYGDPQNYLGQVVYGRANSYYSDGYSYINEITEETPENKALLDAYKEFTRLIEEADAITADLDKRYQAYAKAEAYLLEHVLVLPVNYRAGWCLTNIDNTSRMNAMFGVQNDKMKNWRTNKNGYTAEEVAQLEQEHAAAAKA